MNQQNFWLCLCLASCGAFTCSTQGTCEATNFADEAPAPAVRQQTLLSPLLLEGHELHRSVITSKPDAIRELPTGMKLPKNPHLSQERPFVEAVARGGSQGRLDGRGMHSALYARYVAEGADIGIYGLEAASTENADAREKEIRKIWAHNERLNRTRVYREGLVLVVVWVVCKGDPPSCWEAVQAKVEKRLRSIKK